MRVVYTRVKQKYTVIDYTYNTLKYILGLVSENRRGNKNLTLYTHEGKYKYAVYGCIY